MEVQNHGGNGEGPQDVGEHAGFARRPRANREELQRVEASATTLAVGLDVLGPLRVRRADGFVCLTLFLDGVFINGRRSMIFALEDFDIVLAP